MIDNILKPTRGCTKKKRRLGCGVGSKLGSTCGRGHDGQKSRSGKNKPYLGFEGGQMPLYRRIPKMGFNRKGKKLYLMSLDQLSQFEEGEIVNVASLKKKHLISRQYEGLVILCKGDLTKKINIEADRVSKNARNVIEKAGGKIQLVREIQ